MINESTVSEPVAAQMALPDDFETALAQLEALVARMEGGSLPLDQSLASYEEELNWPRFANSVLMLLNSRLRSYKTICLSL